MTDGIVAIGVFIHQRGTGQIRNIDHEGLGRDARSFIEFVSQIEVLLIGREPTLMGISTTWVLQLPQQHDVGLVGHIDDVQRDRIVARAEKCHLIACPGACLHLDDLGIMNVAIGPVSFEHGSTRVVQVVKTQPVAAATTPIQVARVSIDGDIVRGESSACRDGVGQRKIAIVDIGEIDHLNPSASLGYGICKVLIGLHISPQTIGTSNRSEDGRVARIADLDHRGAARMRHQCVLTTTGRGVSPAIISIGDTRTHLRQGDPGLKIDPIGREASDRSERLWTGQGTAVAGTRIGWLAITGFRIIFVSDREVHAEDGRQHDEDQQPTSL